MKTSLLAFICVALCVGCGGGGNHEVPTGPAVPTALTSVCGGAVQSVPRVCNVEVTEHYIGSSAYAVVTFDAADLEGDIDFVCVSMVSVLGVLPPTCGTVVVAGGTLNGPIITEPLRVRARGVQANWVVEVGVEDQQGHVSNTATTGFFCCGSTPCRRQAGPCVFADDCCSQRCTNGVCT